MSKSLDQKMAELRTQHKLDMRHLQAKDDIEKFFRNETLGGDLLRISEHVYGSDYYVHIETENGTLIEALLYAEVYHEFGVFHNVDGGCKTFGPESKHAKLGNVEANLESAGPWTYEVSVDSKAVVFYRMVESYLVEVRVEVTDDLLTYAQQGFRNKQGEFRTSGGIKSINDSRQNFTEPYTRLVNKSGQFLRSTKWYAPVGAANRFTLYN